MKRKNSLNCLACPSLMKTIGEFERKFNPIGSNDSIHFNWPIKHCSRCGLIRIDGDFQIFEKYHYALATYRDPSLDETWRVQRKNYFHWLINCIEKINIPNKSIIDFGCSYGHMLQLMRDRGWRIGGVEIDKRLLEVLEQRFPESKISNDLKHIPEIGSWGICTMIDSLYYVKDPLKTLIEVKNVLAPGGYIFIRVTNRNWLLRLMAYFKKKLNMSLISSALTHFSKKSLYNLILKAGFTDMSWIYREKGRTYCNLKTWTAYNILPLTSLMTKGYINFSPGLVLYAKKK